MTPVVRSALGRLNLTLLGIAILCSTFWFTDQTTNRHPPAPHVDRAALVQSHRTAPPKPKLFVLIIDSLRFETAENHDVMPVLATLKAEGVFAKVRPGFNSSSAAALRDAFTGRENAAVLALVATFLKTDAAVESIFHQMSLAGFTSTAHSMGFFRQFGAGITREVDVGYRAPREVEEESILAAAQELATGDYDVAIGHIGYTDYAAHDFGIFRRQYREAFHRVDAFIPLVRAAVPPGTTFVVMGDHGHDETGKHGFGMEVPTFALYIGEAFKRGFDLGTIQQTSHRYLMSHSIGLPVEARNYTGEHLPQALDVAHDKWNWAVAQAKAARSFTSVGTIAFVWTYISVLAALWLNLLARGRSPLRLTTPRLAVLWLALVPLVLPAPWQVITGALMVGGLLVVLGRDAGVVALLRWIGVPVLAALAFIGWGRVLIQVRPELHGMSYAVLGCVWLAIGLIGASLSTRRTRTVVMWWVVGAAILLLHGSNERYGFQGTLAPLMGCWIVFYLVALWRDGAVRDRRGWRRAGFAVAGVFLLIQPFAATGETAGTFNRWHALIPGWDVDSAVNMALLAFFAKAVIFFPRWPGGRVVVVGSVLIYFLVGIEARTWVPNSYLMMGFLFAALVGWRVLKRVGADDESRLLRISFWFLLYYYSTALTPRNFLEIGCMVGAIVLCARLASWFPQTENLRSDYLVLAILGLLVTGWACMRWSTSDLEWHAAYDWFSAPVVEHGVALLVGWIALKCLLVWVLIVGCLDDELRHLIPRPSHALLLVFSLKLVSMLLLNVGLGGGDTLNRSYLEGACVSGVLAILFLGVILLPGAWPAPVATLLPGGARSKS